MNPGRRRAFKEGLKQCERHSKELKRLSKASRKRLKEELKNRKKELERHLKKRDGEHTPETIRMNQQIEYIENLLP
jgi:mRNA-degrading endonuclease RelE of RelBE toxin-antitoxin system